MRTRIKDYLKLYLVLETSLLRLPLGDFIVQAIEGGVTAVQLRDKVETAKNRYETAKSLRALIGDRDVLFIINNDPDLALAAGAQGVHLGIEDLPPSAVRRAFPQLITGYSCNNADDCALAISSEVDYAGVGPVFFTGTKTDPRPVIGIDGTENIVRALPVPCVAIGGINEENAERLSGREINRIAVSSALCSSDTPYDTAVKLRSLIEKQ